MTLVSKWPTGPPAAQVGVDFSAERSAGHNPNHFAVVGEFQHDTVRGLGGEQAVELQARTQRAVVGFEAGLNVGAGIEDAAEQFLRRMRDNGQAVALDDLAAGAKT